MKKISILTIASAFLMFMASCQKSPVQNAKGDGFLSFGEFSLEVDEAVDTKADPAGDNYSIEIIDADGALRLRCSDRGFSKSTPEDPRPDIYRARQSFGLER